MKFFIQYDQNLITIEIRRKQRIGELYHQILDETHMTPHHVVSMVHNESVIGVSPYSFEAKIYTTDLHENSIIFVILNHYPEVTLLYSHSTLELYEQWICRHNTHLDHNRLIFDPISQRHSHTRRNNSSAPAPASTPLESSSHPVGPATHPVAHATQAPHSCNNVQEPELTTWTVTFRVNDNDDEDGTMTMATMTMATMMMMMMMMTTTMTGSIIKKMWHIHRNQLLTQPRHRFLIRQLYIHNYQIWMNMNCSHHSLTHS